jgi:3-dehydroquinate synthetase
MAEVVKHGVIGDETLFHQCGAGWQAVNENLDSIIRRGMAVKLKVIEADPYEKGLRQALNLGHTIGHGVELASDFHLSHGEAVGIGTVAEARLAESIGLAEHGLSDRIAAVLSGIGLPTMTPADIDFERVVEAMQLDKKRRDGQVRFALPVHLGEVRVGVTVDEWQRRVIEQRIIEREG